jgi:hypothetical protein
MKAPRANLFTASQDGASFVEAQGGFRVKAILQAATPPVCDLQFHEIINKEIRNNT